MPLARSLAAAALLTAAIPDASAFDVSETGFNNSPPNLADSLRTVDVGTGSISPVGDIDWWVTEARFQDLMFILVEASASTSSTDTVVEIFTDLDLSVPLAGDSSSGPLAAAAVAGVPMPALADRMFFRVGEDGGNEEISDYSIHHYVADPSRAQTEAGEPNDTPGTAEPIVVPLVNAEIATGIDTDLFSFEARAGQRIVVIVDEDPLGDGLVSTELALLDPSGAELAGGDDQSVNPANALGPVPAPADGRYYVRIDGEAIAIGEYRFVVLVDGRPPVALGPLPESEGGTPGAGGTFAFKSLHSMEGAIQFGTDVDYAELLGRPGDRVYAYAHTGLSSTGTDSLLSIRDDADAIIEVDAFSGPGLDSAIAGAILTSSRAYHRIQENGQDQSIDRIDHYIAVVAAADVDDEIVPENNASIADADPFTATRMRGTMNTNDTDFWRVEARAGDNLVFIVDEDPDDFAGDTVDTRIAILDAAGNVLAEGDNLASNDANAVGPIVAPLDGPYYARVVNGAAVIDQYEIVAVLTDGPVRAFPVAGTVAGLAPGNQVSLGLNGIDTVTVAADGPWAFGLEVGEGQTYSVEVTARPVGPSQTCTVANGSGAMPQGGVNDVTVTCAIDTFSIGGVVENLLPGNALTLQINGGETLSVNADGPFVFPTELLDGSGFDVAVLVQPDSPPQDCGVIDGSGTVSGRDVNGIRVVCGLIFGDGFEG